jgi:hypothetical protein
MTLLLRLVVQHCATRPGDFNAMPPSQTQSGEQWRAHWGSIIHRFAPMNFQKESALVCGICG